MSLTSQLGTVDSKLANIELAPIITGSSGVASFSTTATLHSTFAPFISAAAIQITGELGDKIAPAALGRFVLAFPGVLLPVPPSQLTGILGDFAAPALLSSIILAYGAQVAPLPTVQFTSAVTLSSKFAALGFVKSKVTLTSTFAAVILFGVNSHVTLTSTFTGTLIKKGSYNNTVRLSSTFTPTIITPTSVASTVTLTSTFAPHLILNPKLNIIVDDLLSGGFKKES